MTNVVKKISLFGNIILRYELRKNKTPWIKVPKDIIKTYRETTTKNKLATDDKIAFKINREYYSGSPSSINDKRDIINYGYMIIIKDNEKNKISYILNSKENRNGKINFETKDKMTSIYMSVFGGGEV